MVQNGEEAYRLGSPGDKGNKGKVKELIVGTPAENFKHIIHISIISIKMLQCLNTCRHSHNSQSQGLLCIINHSATVFSAAIESRYFLCLAQSAFTTHNVGYH